jgi:hypothetical protein
MIHIVFNASDVDVLQKAIELDPGLGGEVMQVKDEFAVGPILNIYEEEGIEARKQWWREVLAGGEYEGKVDDGSVDDPALVARLRASLQTDPGEIIWIWAAQNKHDVSGYYWIMSQFRDFQGRIFILYLNNLPFINEKGHIFYPEWLSMIPPREFIKAKKLARPISPAEFEVDPDEWNRLQQENKGVRVLEGGKKLQQYDYDFYDNDLRKFITVDWQKAGRLIHQFLGRNKHTTGDAFLLWRLKKLVAEGGYDVQGELKGMKDFELKSKAEAIAGIN